MFFDEDCNTSACLFATFMPYLGGALAVGVGTAVLAPFVLPAAIAETAVFGIGAEQIIATGAMAI